MKKRIAIIALTAIALALHIAEAFTCYPLGNWYLCAGCMTGPAEPIACEICTMCDANGDGYVDLADAQLWQQN